MGRIISEKKLQWNKQTKRKKNRTRMRLFVRLFLRYDGRFNFSVVAVVVAALNLHTALSFIFGRNESCLSFDHCKWKKELCKPMWNFEQTPVWERFQTSSISEFLSFFLFKVNFLMLPRTGLCCYCCGCFCLLFHSNYPYHIFNLLIFVICLLCHCWPM